MNVSRVAAFAGMITFLLTTSRVLAAPQEFPPPQGKGRVVVLSSGMSGPANYVEVAQEISQLGYDVVLFDGNAEEHTQGEGVREAIQQALTMPHALPGKVALVGFSLGGGESLYYGTQWPDLVSGAVLWYPANAFIHDLTGFANRLQVPVVVFAGGQDDYRNGCCTAANDTALQAAAKAAGKSFDLTIYPEAKHDFVKGERNYDASAFADAFQRMANALKRFLPQ
jgi:alpha-beta hydrolase superfamily lysophospholipase